MAWPKLTSQQQRALFALIRQQLETGQEIVFEVSGGWEVEIFPWRQVEYSKKIVCPKEVVELLSDLELVKLGRRGIGGGPLAFDVTTLLLRQEALEYYAWMQKPGWYRWLVEQWSGARTEIRAAIISMIFAILTTIVTNLLLGRLNP